jgi:pimeloyl-ACP methyl ester carboxylesterase
MTHTLLEQAGEGPAVMLVHAGIADRRMWRDHLPWLAANGWHAIAPDLPGFGEHVPSADPPAPWDFLRDWTAESEAMERGDIDAAVDAVVAAWLAPDAPGELRDLVAGMQRRAFELDPEGTMPQPPDPLEEHPERVREIAVPALIAAGESDMPDFTWSAKQLADALPQASHHVIAGAGHLAPLEAPAAFRELLSGFLAGLGPG